MSHIDNYLAQDRRWEYFGIENFEYYQNNFVVKTCFHKNVHEDVVKSYKIAEYLMAHSYYYYPMYDEALGKLTGIFEMSVKLRVVELGIDLEYTDRNGRKRKKILARLINDLISFGYPTELKSKLDWIRSLRNYKAHPSSYSFVGGTMWGKIIPIVNILNTLFKPPNWLKDQKTKLIGVQNESQILKDKCFVLDHNGRNVLVYDPEPKYAIGINNKWLHVWNFKPVLIDTKVVFTSDRIPSPIVHIFCNEIISQSCLTGRDFWTDKEVKIIETKKTKNIDAYKKHIKEYSELSKDDVFIFESLLFHELSKTREKLIYENCWK